jgi:hypothetical protein
MHVCILVYIILKNTLKQFYLYFFIYNINTSNS